jgi:SAM-dependent methyltransferase
MKFHLDTFSSTEVSGWLISEKALTELAVEVEGRELARFAINPPKADVGKACNFHYKFPERLPAFEAKLRLVGGDELPGSPFNLLANLKKPKPGEIAWAKDLELPDPKEMAQIGSSTKDIFILQGTRMSGVLYDAIVEYFGHVTPGLRFLDFGCGVGRVAIPLVSRLPSPRFHACDVNPEAIKYIQRVLPDAKADVTGFQPPLPYEDASFDCIYSISIWTHLPISMQLRWLQEIKRILKPHGLALISFSGPQVTKLRQSHEAWRGISPDDVKEQGIIYRPYPNSDLAGITGSYGLTAHDPSWITRVFDKILTVLNVKPQAIEGTQDLVAFTRLE